MTIQEFKAWFGGYTEEMKGPPDVAQWERIKARVQEIDGTPVIRDYLLDPMQSMYDLGRNESVAG